MSLLFIIIAISFVILLIVNISWISINVAYFIIFGIEDIIKDENLVQSIYGSIYFKWIILCDVLWLCLIGSYIIKRRRYKTEESNYLSYNKINNPNICIILPTYNEEKVVGKVIKDFKIQPNVKNILVIDNHSEDKTVKIAEESGAKVIKKEKNMGYSHSCIMGFREALKTDSNIIVLVDADGTFNAYDLSKMIPYLDNCDLVIGSRQIQVLSEKGNQNTMFFIWGNLFLAKVLQLKYFSLQHTGVAEIEDLGCSFRCIKRESLIKIIDAMDKAFIKNKIYELPFSPLGTYMAMISIENNLKIIQIPITFQKRIGESKSGVSKKKDAFRVGMYFLWAILKE